MAGSKALSVEIAALFDTVRQQAHAYAEAFSRVEALLEQLQQQRVHLQQETEQLRQQAETVLEHLRKEVEGIVSFLTHRAASVWECAQRLERVESEIQQVQHLPERFAEQVAEALAQAEVLVRGTEQKVAIILRNLQEELRYWEQRVEAVHVLAQRETAELRQWLQKLEEAYDPAQLRQHVLQAVENRFQQLEQQLTELATALVQLTSPVAEPAPLPPQPAVPEELTRELATVRQRLRALEHRAARLPAVVVLACVLSIALAAFLAVLLG